jgi:hypothetical protein
VLSISLLSSVRELTRSLANALLQMGFDHVWRDVQPQYH